MTLAEFVGVIKRWIWMIVAIVVFVTGLTAFNALTVPKTYRAETKIISGLSQVADTSVSGITFIRGSAELSAAYAQLVEVNEVMTKSLEKAGLDWDENTLKSEVTAAPSEDAPLITISVTDNDQQRSITLVNAVADSFVEYIQEINDRNFEKNRSKILSEITDIQEQIDALSAAGPQANQSELRTLQSALESALNQYDELLVNRVNSADVNILDPATTATEVGINASQKIALAVIVGLISGVVLAFIAEAIRVSLRSNNKE